MYIKLNGYCCWLAVKGISKTFSPTKKQYCCIYLPEGYVFYKPNNILNSEI